ncbi:alpha/beta-hydrolase [Crepidotus variabilis]|uniref:Alpha/beta-hydrolase n=1 Tax=Crepidotus variabilis TaxID=179855 RepID=A0A9P6EKQ5_9AGAR|nr:alpha/beta-hydrolase [Crepidotus variabilis]
MASTFTGPEIPFKIDVSEDQLSLLQRKLELATFPDELENVGRDYGPSLVDIKRLVARWQTGYDWKKHEAQLNESLPQFKRKITVDGFRELDIHYVHKKSTVDGAIPLLFIPGWPGSFVEVGKILPLLTQPDDPATQPSFHVVALSLPGFGFSSAPKQRGFALNQFAEVSNKLMVSLGYETYVTQGGDWGGHITQRMAVHYGKKHVLAWHTNYAFAAKIHKIPTGSFKTFNPTNEDEKAAKERSDWFDTEGRGYGHLQGTQPQTPGYALADSPVGLLAWVYEKLVNWSDKYPWEDDEVLTWISIYWFSAAGPAASLRIYYERTHEAPELDNGTAAIPLGLSLFPKEIYSIPKAWLKDPNLVFVSEHKTGGHFAAHEDPLGLVNDLRKFFSKGGPAFGGGAGNKK